MIRQVQPVPNSIRKAPYLGVAESNVTVIKKGGGLSIRASIMQFVIRTTEFI